jgi:peptidyl-tRNA hydrolase, PTH1 family
LSNIRVICGLGNPREQYKDSPHNAGFRVIEGLAKQLDIYCKSPEESLLRAIFQEKGWLYIGEQATEAYSFRKYQYDDVKVYLLTPLLFMNLSGAAINRFIWDEDIYFDKTTDLLVVYDELDIPFGDIKVVATGSAGNNNGCKNIDEVLGLNGKWHRVKVGTQPSYKVLDKLKYVIEPIPKDYETPMLESEQKAQRACLSWVHNGIQTAMNFFNTKPKVKENQ